MLLARFDGLRAKFLLLALILGGIGVAAMPIVFATDETNTTTISTNVVADAWIGSISTPIAFSDYDTFGNNTVDDSVTVKCNLGGWSLKVKDSITDARSGYLRLGTTNLTYPLEVQVGTTYYDLKAERALVSSADKVDSTYDFTYRQRGSALDSVAEYTISLTYTITYG